MHSSSWVKSLAVFYIYLVATAWAQTVAPEVRRSLFSSSTLEFDSTGQPIVKDIVKSTTPSLEVTNHLQNSKGDWHNVRSLGGPMAQKWLELHGAGHPNTTVKWSNGTVVQSHEVEELLTLAKRWGWGDSAIELTLWGSKAFTITNTGLVAGFAAVVVTGLLYWAYNWLSSGKSNADVVESGNNQRRGPRPVRRSNFEPNVYYHQTVGNMEDTGKWPAGADMQNAVHSAMQDMADHDYQGACYDAVTNDPVFGPGEGCPITEFAQLGLCTWPNGGSCTTPSCELSIGEYTQCTGDRAADGQYGKKR